MQLSCDDAAPISRSPTANTGTAPGDVERALLKFFHQNQQLKQDQLRQQPKFTPTQKSLRVAEKKYDLGE